MLALLHLAGNAVTAFLLFVLPHLPVENTTPDQTPAWPFALVGAALLGSSAAVVAGVVRGRAWVFLALAVQLAVGLAFLRYALGQSDHSDEKLLLFATVVEAAGVFAALLSLDVKRPTSAAH
jgi:CelD/BcsL family acetyltransferase involved in cellulose biosynthesis